jgi:tight adherence protein B
MPVSIASVDLTMNEILILSTVLMGAGVGLLVWAGRDSYDQALDYVEADFKDKLKRLRRRSTRLRQYIAAWWWFVLAVFMVLWIVYDLFVLGLLIAVLMLGLPWYILRRMAETRRQQIEDQLADAMVAMSSSIKAGLSLAQALDILARQTPRPICQEFQQLHGEYQLGKPMERCLVETKERLRSENFALFAAAMEASRESGGRLNETVDRIAHSVRELQRLERKVMSETAQARTQAVYMSMVPFGVLALYYFVLDPENTTRLFQTVPGQMMLSVAVILNVVAYVWARVILNPEI